MSTNRLLHRSALRSVLAVAIALMVPALISAADAQGDDLAVSAAQGSEAGGSFDAAEVFVNANGAYEAGDYEQAIAGYTALLQHGYCSGVILYNLGNAYLRNGELGRAIASYRRSQVLEPRNEDLLANLAFARKTAKDALTPPQPSAVSAILFFWHYDLSPSELALAALVLNLLFWLAMGAALLRRGSEALRWIRAVLLILLLACLTSLVVHLFVPQRLAVIIPQEVNVRTGPSEEAVVHFKLHAGSEVSVKDERDGWFRVALPDGQQGWVGSETVEVVEL